MLIALPPEHPLIPSAEVTLAELARDRWMLGTTTSCPDANRFIQNFHAAGLEPNIAFHNDDYTAILGFVAAGVGVAAVPEMVARGAPRQVTIRPLGPEPLTRPILAALPAGYRPRPASAMLDVLSEISRRWVAKRPREFARMPAHARGATELTAA